jgi:hypothetical protein
MSPTHKPTEGRSPVWGSEFTTKAATLQGGVIVVLRPLFAAALVERRRYLIMVPRPLPVAPLVRRRRYLIFVPRPMLAAPRTNLIVVCRPLPAAPLVVRCMCMVMVPGPMPAAVASRCCRRRFNSWLAPAARSSKSDSCGCSFAVLSTKVTTNSWLAPAAQ